MTKKSSLTLAILNIVYFLLMIRFYLANYYAPDFRKYYGMNESGEKAMDGFSSLFILITGLGGAHPKLLHVLILLFISIGLFCISYFVTSLFEEKNINWILSLVVLYSCGVFYYFYGKLYYDVPFSIINFGIALILLCRIQKKGSIDAKWYLMWILLGLFLSWKAYNVFALSGVGLLILGKEEYRKIVVEFIKNPAQIIFSIICLGLGYLVGNYNLIKYPRETIKGIKAYEAQSDFVEFLFTKDSPQWDHVNNLPFNISVFCVISLVLLMLIVPIIYKKIYYVLVSIFMFGCLYLFITKFSPGFTWHGFTYGLFIVCFVAFVISEIEIKHVVNKAIIGLAIIIQLGMNLGYYIPKQICWFNETENAIDELVENETQIYEDTLYLMHDVDEATFCIDQVVKRFTPVEYEGKYVFCDPLKYTNFNGWNELESLDNNIDYDYMWSADYIIWIIPKSFYKLEDVYRLDFHDNKEVVKSIEREDYTISLLKKVN